MKKSEKELVHVSRTIGGCYLKPADKDNCPLLIDLMGGPEDVGSLIEGKFNELMLDVRRVAKERGITAQFCGNLMAKPSIYLSRQLTPPKEEPAMIFAGLRGDCAHRGITDFYDENSEALKAAIASGGAFDTGWYGVKHEIQSARIRRLKKNGPILLAVRCEMDEPSDLVDTAFWEASGKTAQSGLDALIKLGLSESESEETMVNIIDRLHGNYGFASSEESDCQLHWKTGHAKVLQRLESMVDDLDEALKSSYEWVVGICREEYEDLKLERSRKS